MSGININPVDLEWWTAKVQRRGSGCFNLSVGHWSAHLLNELVTSGRISIETNDLEELAETLGVPYKFLTRSVATLTRCGVVYATLHPIPVLVLQLSTFPKRKGTAQSVRTPLSKRAKEEIYTSDGYVCAHCLTQFDSAAFLDLDHIVPVSLLGADEPGNLVSMCKECNLAKSDQFERNYIKQYRMIQVEGPIALRFLSGRFWPVINGSILQQTR